jgi:hypothetical protein
LELDVGVFDGVATAWPSLLQMPAYGLSHDFFSFLVGCVFAWKEDNNLADLKKYKIARDYRPGSRTTWKTLACTILRSITSQIKARLKYTIDDELNDPARITKSSRRSFPQTAPIDEGLPR